MDGSATPSQSLSVGSQLGVRGGLRTRSVRPVRLGSPGLARLLGSARRCLLGHSLANGTISSVEDPFIVDLSGPRDITLVTDVKVIDVTIYLSNGFRMTPSPVPKTLTFSGTKPDGIRVGDNNPTRNPLS